MKLARKGLFGIENKRPTYVAETYGRERGGFSIIVSGYTKNQKLRDALYNFLRFIKYNINNGGFKNQLNSLSKFDEETQIQIVNRTVQKKWHSLLYEIDLLKKNKFDNTTTDYISKEQIKQSIDICKEKF